MADERGRFVSVSGVPLEEQKEREDGIIRKRSIDFYLERAWTVLRYAFFKEEEYDGLNSHQEQF